jgi:predicted DNA-binding WGR domain protein
MTQVVNVEACTVLQTDYNANIDKFYTTYSLGPYEIRQWGRIGVIGQFSIEKHASPSAAAVSARGQINAKVRKGYTDGRTDVTFQFDLDKLGANPGKEQAKWVAHAKDAYERTGATVTKVGNPTNKAIKVTPGARGPAFPIGPKTVIEVDRFEDFTNRALAAITQAVTDPAQASITYAKLNGEWEELQAVTEKAQSYLSTLDSLVSASMA